MSPSGVFITTDGDFEIGQDLRFTIEFDNPIDGGGSLCLDCVGKVERIEREHGRIGIGVSINESRLERRTRRTGVATTAAKARARR